MSIRYFTKWLQDEERSFADYQKPWAWLDLNVTDPPPGVIYLHPRPVVLGENGLPTEHPLLVGAGDNFELSANDAVAVDGGSASFIVRRSTLYIFNYTPLVILVLGIITNTIQLALCCRLRHKLPAVAFIATIAAADLVCILLGSGRMSIDRLFATSLDHLHSWSCKMRHFLLASAFDLSVWLVPLGLCELWRPASRIIIYATITSLLLNLHNLVTRGRQVQGDYAQVPIFNDCGFTFPDARVFWLHIHPIVSVIINVIGPAFTAMLLVITLSFQGRCHPAPIKLKDSFKNDPKKAERKKRAAKQLRINLLILFAVLAAVQTILLSPTAILATMELFLNTTVHPSMRALVLFCQLLNCSIKLPLIFLAAPQLCPAMSESTMGFYGEKPKNSSKNSHHNNSGSKNNKSKSRSREVSESTGENSSSSELENEDHSSLVVSSNAANGKTSRKENNVKRAAAPSSSSLTKKSKTKTKSATKRSAENNHKHNHKHSHDEMLNDKKYEEMIALDAEENEAAAIDAGKQLALATSTMNRRPPPPPSLSLISTEHYYQQSNSRPQTAMPSNQFQQKSVLPQQQMQAQQQQHQHQQLLLQQQQAVAAMTMNPASHRHTSLVTSSGIATQGQASSTLPMPPPPHLQQLYWLNEKGDSNSRKIYV